MTKPVWPEDLNAETWKTCDNLWLFADFFNAEDLCPRPPSDRKLRLLFVAAVRSVWEHVAEPESRTAVEEAERYVDEPDLARLNAAGDLAERVYRRVGEPWNANDPAKGLAKLMALMAWYAATEGPFDDESGGLPFWVDAIKYLESDEIPARSMAEAEALHLRLLHDLIPNPFRTRPFDPAWQTQVTLALARQMYVDRDFSLMPILGDALQEAGCEDVDVLAHCYGEGPHARGCWVVDLILGKS